jgi:competence protein ComEA
MQGIRTLITAGIMLFASSLMAAPPVDINTAGAEALAEAIDGVGIKRAERIVRYREENGPFKSVDDLVKVQGIGDRILEQSRDRLRVGKP